MSDQHKRKSTGSFYTPPYIVDFMVDRVFSYLISDKRLDVSTFKSYAKSLAQLSFCDPSIGNGNFLIGILGKVWSDLKMFSSVRSEDKTDFFKRFFEQNVFGVELDLRALKECKERIPFFFPQLMNCNYENLKHGNSIVEYDSYQMFTEQQASQLNPLNWQKKFGSKKFFDVILGNPPYYNLKKMELIDENTKILFEYLKHSEIWLEYYRSSSDIYYYFIIKALELLSEGGLLSFIIPNYWIENKYADKLREYVLNYQILELLDLSNLRIFKDNGKWLNVSNCITTIQKSSPSKQINVGRKLPKVLLENFTKNNETLPKYCYKVNQANLTKDKWVISPHLEILRMIEAETQRLDNLAQIVQGMSPGVKDVFVIATSEAQELELESEVLVPFITNSDVKRWFVDYSKLKTAILPSKIKNLAEFPQVQLYLETHKIRLTQGSDRKRLLNSNKIRWFDFSVYRNLNVFQQANNKIFVPYRSLIPRFGLDFKSSFGATDIYAIVPKKNTDMLYLLGILNSDVIHFWYSEAGKRKGKMLEFFSDPLRSIPIPLKTEKKFLISKVKELLKVLEDSDNNLQEIRVLESSINKEVARLYDVDYDTIKKFLEKSVK